MKLDEEFRAGEAEFPILIVGTKLDLIKENEKKNSLIDSKNFITKNFMTKFFCDEIQLNCYDAKFLAAGSTNSLKLSRFFDQVIQKEYCSSLAKNPRKFV